LPKFGIFEEEVCKNCRFWEMPTSEFGFDMAKA
jgi:hypothetical protein